MSQIQSLQDRISTQPQGKAGSSFNDLDVDAFFDLMIAELQNQDPLNPLENDELLAQINQIREVGATDKLTETLDSVLLGQNITSATGLIGKQVNAISDDNVKVVGDVEKVTIEEGVPKLHISLPASAKGVSQEGNVAGDTYDYLVTWDTPSGPVGSKIGPVTTTGTKDFDKSIELKNLPKTDGPKRIYRTTKEEGDKGYKLAAIITDGNQATHVDTLDDKELSIALSKLPPIVNTKRAYTAKLSNLSEVNAE